jgi:hypothetical protein
MVEWGKRMIDRPAWFATYARMQDAQEKMAANMPTRLKGKVRIPAPWLPDWAGGGLWVDPTAKLFPFAPFGQPFEQFAKNTDQVAAAGRTGPGRHGQRRQDHPAGGSRSQGEPQWQRVGAGYDPGAA